MQLVDTIASDGSNAGKNPSSLAVPFGATKTYKLYAEKEGVYIVHSYGATVGSDGNEGQISNSLFGQVIVEPKGAKSYRGLLTEEEMRLATTGTHIHRPSGHRLRSHLPQSGAVDQRGQGRPADPQHGPGHVTVATSFTRNLKR